MSEKELLTNRQYPWIIEAVKATSIILIIQLVASVVSGWYTGQMIYPLLLSLFVALPALILAYYKPFKTVTHHVIAIALQAMTAIHIQIWFGLTELHFQIFVMLGVIAWFREWRIYISSVIFITIHHVSFFFLQSSGAEVFIFEVSHLMVGMLISHAFFAIAQSVVLGIMSKSNRETAIKSLHVEQVVDSIVSEKGKIDLSYDLEKDINLPINELLSSFKSVAINSHKAKYNTEREIAILNESFDSVNKSTVESAMQVSVISSAMEEMRSAISENAERTSDINENTSLSLTKTRQASEIISDTQNKAELLTKKLLDMSHTIKSLDNKANSITEVMNTIESVAERTNLLALNAAIEAARAGEQGRGFAVVADEVRGLAEVTSKCTVEIKKVVNELVKESHEAVEVINECVVNGRDSSESSIRANEVMHSLLDMIKSVSEDISSVAVSIEEQVNATGEINSVSQRLNDITQINEENVHISNAATQRIVESFKCLEESLEVLKVN